MTKSVSGLLSEECADLPRRDRGNIMRYLWAMGGWAVCFAGGSQLLKRGLVPAGPISWIIALIPSIAGLVVLMAYSRFLRESDELQRLIQLQALAVGFGGTFFAVSGYRILERAGAPPIGISDISLFMAVLYTIGILIGHWRYR